MTKPSLSSSAGATGIIAALAAREAGASFIVVEAEAHIGAQAICSGGNLSFCADAASEFGRKRQLL